ncbi:alpha/beta hydrolase [Humibacter ginsengisoli]
MTYRVIVLDLQRGPTPGNGADVLPRPDKLPGEHTSWQHRVGDLHVEVRGSGAPLLVIHGNSGDLRFFNRNLPLLAEHHRVVAMDCRGQGRSARGSGPLTLSRMADDAARVIRALGAGTDAAPEPFDVLGFSDGANVAMLLAVRHPELVRSLVLASGNLGVGGLRFGVQWGLRMLYLAAILTPGHARRHKLELLRLMLDAPGIGMRDLSRISAPTLVLAGQHDVIRRGHTRMLASSIPHARLLIVRGGSHTVLRDRAESVTPLIVDFLTS